MPNTDFLKKKKLFRNYYYFEVDSNVFKFLRIRTCEIFVSGLYSIYYFMKFLSNAIQGVYKIF